MNFIVHDCVENWPSMSASKPSVFKLTSHMFTPDYVGSALHMSVFNGDLSSIRYTIQVNAELVNSQDNHGRTPLHLVAFTRVNSLDILQELLSAGANPNIEDEDGNLPLHFVVIRNKFVIWLCFFHSFFFCSFFLSFFKSSLCHDVARCWLSCDASEP